MHPTEKNKTTAIEVNIRRKNLFIQIINKNSLRNFITRNDFFLYVFDLYSMKKNVPFILGIYIYLEW